MTIRPALPADAGTVAALVQRAYERYVERIGRRPRPMDDDYASLVDAGDVSVMEDGGRIVAILVLHAEDDHLLVDNIAVDPGRQGEGLGRELFAFAQRQAAEIGVPELRLYTNAAMTENIALYARWGWEEYDRRGEEGFARVFFRKPAG